MLEGEIAVLHRKYAAARERLLAVCDACQRFADQSTHHRRLLVAGSLLAASAAMPAALLVSGGVTRTAPAALSPP
jgi:hypothetical protein